MPALQGAAAAGGGDGDEDDVHANIMAHFVAQCTLVHDGLKLFRCHNVKTKNRPPCHP